MQRHVLPSLVVTGLAITCVLAAPASAALPEPATLRVWVEEMKESPRGPFEAIRWFCRDGTVLPPKPYACAQRGGGVQHGLWNQRATRMREGGYQIATVLASLDSERFVGDDADLDALGQILIERFLMRMDDGWIFRGARTYRGALQIEDEEAGSQRLVLALLADPRWREPARFAFLRETVRGLPLQADEASAANVRQLALELADDDKGFMSLRAKIHNAPEPGDAEKVRDYARTKGSAQMRKDFERLADAIDALYQSAGAVATLEEAAEDARDPELADLLRLGASKLAAVGEPAERIDVTGRLLEVIRDSVATASDPGDALDLLDASLALENEFYAAGNVLLASLPKARRIQRLGWLEDTLRALYGVGFISRRHLEGARASLRTIVRTRPLTVDAYRGELRYLARAPEWSGRWLAFNFSLAEERLAPLEPLVHLFPQDRLRGSPLLFYSTVIDSMVRDANRLAGIEHQLFGRRIGAGLRALNPGLARGTLRAPESDAPLGSHDRHGIYLLPESTADLPRVAGILTRGEGSSLSHVQLLARNLGIPNVVVDWSLLPEVQGHDGQGVVLAVSPQGVVQLDRDGPRWARVFGESERQGEVVIRPDLEKLDLSAVDFVPLSDLRATDSGRTSGPKGANLGELKHAFGDAVPDGFVVPFGAFRKLLDQPLEPGGPPVFAWMKENYQRIDAMPEGPAQDAAVARFLTRLRAWIAGVDPGEEFLAQLRRHLSRFGPDGSFGVFVRSDTNVEDLPGFTGAGLNLTVANVVGYDNIVRAIHEVWASPFTERAYGWRQSHMETPEFVFPAVVIQRSFPSEKSGVMVTADVDTGRMDRLSIAVNEGVGGAVEGQATESLLVDADGGVRFQAQATAPQKAVLSRTGGIDHAPASGSDEVLKEPEIAQLVQLSVEVPMRFETLRTETGQPVPADIEFAFREGRLTLLQIRPFVESKSAQRNSYLQQLDAAFAQRGSTAVDLRGIPEEPS
jgi:hypothetical protein